MTVTLSVQPTPTAPGLTLRPWLPRDVPALCAVHHDPVLRHWFVTDLRSETDARRWIDAENEAWAAGTRFSFAVVEGIVEGAVDDVVEAGSETERDPVDHLVGHVVLKVRPEAARPDASSELGYWTAPGARGKGVAVRAVEAVSRWAFASGRLARPGRLEVLHDAANEGSCRVAEKCGFVLHSVLPPSPDHPVDSHVHVRVDDTVHVSRSAAR
ncbi:GNAT family N-acetyltransferase [Streptomyces sp. NPDC059002]|uniref:GNAT family N-acetyltransferase n=1 Tax=Streptomyces sp. NPDC059002 TaxID=3346690 RepID=UPI0036A48A63